MTSQRHTFSDLADMRERLHHWLSEYRPELIPEFDVLTCDGCLASELGPWLDENFPLPLGSWGHVSVDDTLDFLNEHHGDNNG